MTKATETWLLIEPYAQRMLDEALGITDGGGRRGAESEYPILLFDGNEIIDFPFTATGIAAALAAAASGDFVFMPTGGLSAALTVGSGITLRAHSRNSTIITGNMTLNGILENIHVIGDVTVSGGIAQITELSGNATVNTGGSIQRSILNATSGTVATLTHGNLRRCSIGLQGAGMLGVDAQDSGGAASVILHENRIFLGSGGGGDGILINGSGTDVSFLDVIVDGLAGDIRDAKFVNNCLFYSTGDNGAEHPSGTAIVSNTYFHTEDGGSDGLSLAAGNITLHDCGWSSIDDLTNVTWGQGDRGSYAVEDYHAGEIESGALRRHLPLPTTPGNWPRADGSVWVSVANVWEPLTEGDGDNPGLIFDENGDTIMVEVVY